MSQIVRGVLGAMAIAGTLGAAQLAVGGDLGQIRSNQHTAEAVAVQAVNRAAKADRLEGHDGQPGQTVAVDLIGQSVLVRIPRDKIGDAVRARAPAQPAAQQRRMVACEPVVSVLTEVAKQLQPGRCVA